MSSLTSGWQLPSSCLLFRDSVSRPDELSGRLQTKGGGLGGVGAGKPPSRDGILLVIRALRLSPQPSLKTPSCPTPFTPKGGASWASSSCWEKFWEVQEMHDFSQMASVDTQAHVLSWIFFLMEVLGKRSTTELYTPTPCLEFLHSFQ